MLYRNKELVAIINDELSATTLNLLMLDVQPSLVVLVSEHGTFTRQAKEWDATTSFHISNEINILMRGA